MDTLISYKKVFIRLLALAVIFVFVSFLIGFLSPEPQRPLTQGKNRQKTFASLERVNGRSEPRVLAEAVFVERLSSHEVLFARNEEKRFATASLAKLMTSLLFVENIPPSGSVLLSKDAKDVLKNDEKRSGVPAGETLNADDVLKLMVAESDNDAAYAAADAVVLGRDPSLTELPFALRIHKFAMRMNERAIALGLRNTHFTNPAGRDEPDNYSTPKDLARIAEEIFGNAPHIWDSSRTGSGTFYSEAGRAYHFDNTDILLKEFPALSGSKTGFTDEAEGALIMLYELAPHDPIVVVILKSNDRFADGRAILRWLDDSFRISPQ